MTSRLPSEIPALPLEGLHLLEAFASIGAPTGHEMARAEYIRRWFDQAQPGLAKMDEWGNVLVDLSDGKEQCWLFDAHTDIVFDDEVLKVVKDGRIWRCPGILDDTANCVLLMLLGRELILRGESLPVILSFTVGEEGEGDLKGIRIVVEQLKARLRGGWCLDLSLYNCTAGAIGSKRWKIVYIGQGGHSWGNFGTPSAIHAMAEWIDRLERLASWEKGRLSYNVGYIAGGTTVNAIAEQAHCALDLRCVESDLLEETSEKVLESLRQTARKSHLAVRIEQIGDRPAGSIPESSPLLAIAKEAHSELNLEYNLVFNSTNANALLAAGIPATCTGFAIGGKVHTREEWLDTSSLGQGWRKLWLILRKTLQTGR